MKITITVILLPPAFMVLAMLFGSASAPLCIVSLVFAIACLVWGLRRVRLRHRKQGWVCISLAVLYFALLSLPFLLPPKYGGPE
jgi:hypothetical protein